MYEHAIDIGNSSVITTKGCLSVDYVYLSITIHNSENFSGLNRIFVLFGNIKIFKSLKGQNLTKTLSNKYIIYTIAYYVLFVVVFFFL